MEKKKKIIIVAVIAVIILTGAGTAAWLLLQKKAGGDGGQQPPALQGMDENVISASGLTSVGMNEETYELDFLETALYIEEAYLSTGDEVEKGTAVFKVSEETLSEAREELENAVTEAELLYRQGKIDYETGKLDAQSVYEVSVINREYAYAEYESSVDEAAREKEKLEEQVEEAKALAEEYARSVNEDYYRTYYEVDELYQTYYEHFNYLMEVYEKWDIDRLSSLLGNSAGSLGTGTGGGQESLGGSSGGNSGGGESAQKLSVYNLFDEMVTEEGEKYTEAKKAYEEAAAKAQAGLAQAESNLKTLSAELEIAETDYEKALISAKADYDTALAESNNAKAVYETTLQSLEEACLELEEAGEEAEENLELFESTIGDGYFYTQSAGTIVMNAVREDSYLSGESMVTAYSDPEIVTVAASVGQDDIASLAVGDSAYAVINGYGNYQGKITSINPQTQAQSRTSVTYQVTVALEGELSSLESNLTAYVYFKMTDEMIEMQERMQGESKEENRRTAQEEPPEESRQAAQEGGSK